MISTCGFSSSIVMPSRRAISGTWWFCSRRRCSVTMRSAGVSAKPRWRSCSVRHSCRSRAATPTGIEVLHRRQHLLDVGRLPVAHRRDLVDRGHQVAVVAEVADDRLADLADRVVVRGHRQLPLQVLGERVLGRQRVLDRGQFLDLDRGAVAARAVVEVVAEEVGVVLVVPALGAAASAWPARRRRPRARSGRSGRWRGCPRWASPRASDSRPLPG